MFANRFTRSRTWQNAPQRYKKIALITSMSAIILVKSHEIVYAILMYKPSGQQCLPPCCYFDIMIFRAFSFPLLVMLSPF